MFHALSHLNTKGTQLFFITKPPNQKGIIAVECLKQQPEKKKRNERKRSLKCGEI